VDDKPAPKGPIPYGFHVHTKNGNALVEEFDTQGPLGVAMVKVLYGISDSRRFEGWLPLGEIKAFVDKGIDKGAFFHEYHGGSHERWESGLVEGPHGRGAAIHSSRNGDTGGAVQL